jgi:phospholipase/carboxylesterase
MTELLETIEIETGANPVYSVIWLHGLGADGHDFEPIVPELALDPERGQPPVRFIFPHAPRRPVTINGGMEMRAWYDISLAGGPGAETFRGNDEHIKASAEQLKDLIAQEQARGIHSDKIILAGFSQGGAIALYTGLRYEKPLAGIMALSTYLPMAEHLQAEQSAVNQSVAIFMAHGQQDSTIPIAVATASKTKMEQAAYQIEWHDYPMAHSVSIEEIQDISAWLKKIMNSK